MGVTESDKVELRLEKLLDRVDGWLKYAETKNAVMLAIGGTGVGTVISLATNGEVSSVRFWGLMVSEGIMVPGVIVAILSFFPQTNLARLLAVRPRPTADSDNLYFYGHINDYRPDELAARIALLYVGIPDYDPALHRGHVDLAEQIVVNSRITETKLRLFAIAVALFVGGLGAAAITLFLSAVT